jgi:hypothetical protein
MEFIINKSNLCYLHHVQCLKGGRRGGGVSINTRHVRTRSCPPRGSLFTHLA